jgi:hypothetical protein
LANARIKLKELGYNEVELKSSGDKYSLEELASIYKKIL